MVSEVTVYGHLTLLALTREEAAHCDGNTPWSKIAYLMETRKQKDKDRKWGEVPLYPAGTHLREPRDLPLSPPLQVSIGLR